MRHRWSATPEGIAISRLILGCANFKRPGHRHQCDSASDQPQRPPYGCSAGDNECESHEQKLITSVEPHISRTPRVSYTDPEVKSMARAIPSAAACIPSIREESFCRSGFENFKRS